MIKIPKWSKHCGATGMSGFIEAYTNTQHASQARLSHHNSNAIYVELIYRAY